jgi:hypothetical protein
MKAKLADISVKAQLLGKASLRKHKKPAHLCTNSRM